MATATTWAPPGPGKYGRSTDGPATTSHSELHSVPTPMEGAAVAANPLHPANPLFWFGVIAAATFGLAAFSTNVRVGKAQLGVSVGSTK